MGWPSANSSTARLIRFGFGVWAVATTTPNTRQMDADSQSILLARVFILFSLSGATLLHPELYCNPALSRYPGHLRCSMVKAARSKTAGAFWPRQRLYLRPE